MTHRSLFLARFAVVFGILLIALETGRRFGHPEQWASMIDDYLGGGFLIVAGLRFRANPARHIRLLCVAWAMLIGGFYYSIAGSIAVARVSAVESTGKSSAWVLAVKIALVLTVILNLACCLRYKDDEL